MGQIYPGPPGRPFLKLFPLVGKLIWVPKERQHQVPRAVDAVGIQLALHWLQLVHLHFDSTVVDSGIFQDWNM